MEYTFTCHGHENITARHKTTLEFTKDEGLGLEGDCIIGVGADFSLDGIKRFIKSLGNNRKIMIAIQMMGHDKKESINNNLNKKIMKNQKNNETAIEIINCEINTDFNSDREIVVRKGDFISERTLGVKANRAAWEIDRSLAALLRNNIVMQVRLNKK